MHSAYFMPRRPMPYFLDASFGWVPAKRTLNNSLQLNHSNMLLFYCFYFLMYCDRFWLFKRLLMSCFGDTHAIIFNLKQHQTQIQIIQANQHNLRHVLPYYVKTKQQKTTKNSKNSMWKFNMFTTSDDNSNTLLTHLQWPILLLLAS